MKARELLRLYRQGKRDFCGVDLSGESLRGMNLKGIDLSGANLSGTDLRGTNFMQAQLVGTEFAYARTGTRRRWIIPIIVVVLVALSLITFLLGGFLTYFWTAIFEPTVNVFSSGNEFVEVISGVIGLGVFAISTVIYYYKGTLAALGAFAVTFAISSAVSSAVSIQFAGAFAGAVAGAFAFAAAFAFAIAFVFAVAGALAFAVAFLFAFAVAVAGAFAFASTQGAFHLALIVILTVVNVILFLGINFIFVLRGLAGDPRDRLIRDVAIGLTCLGGTSFRCANLTDGKFSHTVLKGAHFQGTNLQCTCFHLSKKLHLSRAYSTILANRTVLNLLVSLKSEKEKSYQGLSMKGAYLENADLVEIDFTEADLSFATLAHADL